MIARLDDEAIQRWQSGLSIGEELPRRKGLFGRMKKRLMEGCLENLLGVVDATHGRLLLRPTVGFILLLLQGMMTELGREGRKAGEAP